MCWLRVERIDAKARPNGGDNRPSGGARRSTVATRMDRRMVAGQGSLRVIRRLPTREARSSTKAKVCAEALSEAARSCRPAWLAGKRHVGVTAGASAPDVLVRQVVERLKALGAGDIAELDGVVETTVFPMPKGLASKTTATLL